MNPPEPDAEDLPPFSPEEEATMQAEIELALEPYREIAPASLLATMRESLERALRTHPVPRKLLRAFAPRKDQVGSGEEPVGGADQGTDKADEEKDGA